MVEFMDEDELLAEFHKAGIWLPEEREARERAVESAQRFRSAIGNYMKVQAQGMGNMAQGRSPFAEALGTHQLASLQRSHLHGSQQYRPSTSLLGGLIGGLFG